MKPFKQQLKEEGKIFIHNFISLLCILVGWNMTNGAPNVLGTILGAIILTYGFYLLISALKKGVEEYIENNFPHLLNNFNKKSED